MNQDNHEAHDPKVGLSASNAEATRAALDDHGFGTQHDSGAHIMDKLDDLGSGDEDAEQLTAEEAKVAADYLRAQTGGEDQHKDVLEALDDVAKQHGGAKGTVTRGNHDDAEHDENLR